MPQPLLSDSECRELIGHVRRYFDAVAVLRRESTLAQYLQNPKIPAILSESVAASLISRDNLIPSLSRARRPAPGEPRHADLVAERADGSVASVAVKATGAQGFQNLTSADLQCDWLVWIHFGEYFLVPGPSALDVFTLPRPAAHFPATGKLSLPNLRALGSVVHASRVEWADNQWRVGNA